MTIWSAGYKVRSITALDREKAMKTGSEFVGESFILAVSAGIVVWEYNRGYEKAQEKSELVRAQAAMERSELQAKLGALDARLKALEATVQQNQQSVFSILGGMSTKSYEPPPPEKLVPIVDEDFQESKDVVPNDNTKDTKSGWGQGWNWW